jgi:hypothetical protein
MEEENVNDFSQLPIPTTGTPSFSQNILPGLFGGFQAIGQGMANKYEKQEKEEKLEADKILKRNAAWNQQLYTMPLAYEKDMQQFKTKSTEYNNWVLDKKKRGIDLDNLSTDEALEKKRMEYELAEMAATTKANKDFIEGVQAKYGEDISSGALKYNDKKYTDFMKSFESAATMEERAALRNTGIPLVEDYDLAELVDETIGEIGESVKDTGRREETFRDPAAHAKQVKEYITKSQRGKKMFETLANLGESEDDFVKRVVDAGQVKYPRVTRVQPAPTGGGSRGGTDQNDKNKVSITGQNKIPDARWDQGISANKLTLDKTPAIYAYSNRVINDDGTAEDKSIAVLNFVPQDGFYIKPGGAVTAIGSGTSQDGKLVNVEVDYNYNKGNFTSAGYPDMFDAFRGVSNNQFTATSTGNSVTPPPIDPN